MNTVRICTVRSTSPLQQRYLTTRLGKLMNVYSWFNFKLRKCSSYTCGVNDCNEWKTQKRHKCTNIEKLWTTRNMTAAVRHVTSGAWLRTFSVRFIFVGQSVPYNLSQPLPFQFAIRKTSYISTIHEVCTGESVITMTHKG